MEKDEEHNFRKLIQKAGEEKAPLYFTSNVLRSVQVAAVRQEETENRLAQLLRQNMVETTSVSFNENVIAKLEAYPSKTEQPIISKKVWYLIAACFAGLIVWSFASQTSDVAQQNSGFVSGVDELILGAIPKISLIPIQYQLTFVAVAGLLLLDNLIRQKLVSRVSRV